MSDLLQRLEAEFSLCQELSFFAKDLLLARHVADSTYKTVVLALAAKTLKSYQSVLVLCGHGFGEPALMIVRSMFEDVVNAGYIHGSPVDRSELFAEYDLIEKRRLRANLKRAQLWSEEQEADWQMNWEADYARIRPKFLTKRGEDRTYWSGLNIRQMTEEIGKSRPEEGRRLVKFYYLLYTYASSYAHGGSAMGAGSFLQAPDTSGAVWPLFQPSGSEAREALSMAFGLELDMLAFYSDAWGFLPERLDDLKARGEQIFS